MSELTNPYYRTIRIPCSDLSLVMPLIAQAQSAMSLVNQKGLNLESSLYFQQAQLLIDLAVHQTRRMIEREEIPQITHSTGNDDS